MWIAECFQWFSTGIVLRITGLPISKTYLLHIMYSYTIYLLKEPKYNQIKYRKSLENKWKERQVSSIEQMLEVSTGMERNFFSSNYFFCSLGLEGSALLPRFLLFVKYLQDAKLIKLSNYIIYYRTKFLNTLFLSAGTGTS